ncbi:MAG TPA: class I SAM-dependent methyltransferase [Micromonosporaceae bacterium]
MVGWGTRVRHRLGRLEVPAARLYRGIFVDLAALADHLARRLPAARILEIGCGDGAFATELARVYPDASYLGIDIAPTAGRLFRGDAGRARFEVLTAAELAQRRPEPFDLVCFVDVLHHVPTGLRTEVLAAAAALTAPGGHLVVKEHDRDGTLPCRIVVAADRYVTGDKGVCFMSTVELTRLLGALPGFGPIRRAGVPPLRNNVVYVRQRLQVGEAEPDARSPAPA